MPIYEYICPQGHIEEEIYLDASKAPDQGQCSLCDNDNVRIVSAPKFKLGWVITVNDEGGGKIWAVSYTHLTLPTITE